MICSLTLITIALVWVGILLGLIGFRKDRYPYDRSNLSHCGGIILLMWVGGSWPCVEWEDPCVCVCACDYSLYWLSGLCHPCLVCSDPWVVRSYLASFSFSCPPFSSSLGPMPSRYARISRDLTTLPLLMWVLYLLIINRIALYFEELIFPQFSWIDLESEIYNHYLLSVFSTIGGVVIWTSILANKIRKCLF